MKLLTALFQITGFGARRNTYAKKRWKIQNAMEEVRQWQRYWLRKWKHVYISLSNGISV